METRRKVLLMIASLAAAWMLSAQVALALDGAEKVPSLPPSGTVTPR